MLHLHSVRGEPSCDSAEQWARGSDWQNHVSSAILPEGDTQKRHNLSKLLDITINAQILVKYPDTNVVEIIRMEEESWDQLRTHSGQTVEVMVDGRIFAEGEVIDTEGQSAIRIKKLASA
jgi:flagellar motor switch/type III secretory pathway protein FliN